MTSCAIRYRLDGSGPATFLVECQGELRLYTREALGGVMPESRLLSVLAERGCRWVPARGVVELDGEVAGHLALGGAESVRTLPPTDIGVGESATSA